MILTLIMEDLFKIYFYRHKQEGAEAPSGADIWGRSPSRSPSPAKAKKPKETKEKEKSSSSSLASSSASSSSVSSSLSSSSDKIKAKQTDKDKDKQPTKSDKDSNEKETQNDSSSSSSSKKTSKSDGDTSSGSDSSSSSSSSSSDSDDDASKKKKKKSKKSTRSKSKSNKDKKRRKKKKSKKSDSSSSSDSSDSDSDSDSDSSEDEVALPGPTVPVDELLKQQEHEEKEKSDAAAARKLADEQARQLVPSKEEALKAIETVKKAAAMGDGWVDPALVSSIEKKVAEDDDDELMGPAPPPTLAPALNPHDYGGALKPGEGSAIASFVQAGQRIPRRGEIGHTSDQIQHFEDIGYVMSGSRHKRMNAIRIRKENQVYSAEEKRALSMLNFEEKAAKEKKLMADLRKYLHDKEQEVVENIEFEAAGSSANPP